MADDSPSFFDSGTARRILARLDALERGQNALLNGGHNQAFVRTPIVARWGRTTTNVDYPTYPTTGNTVVVELGDYDPSPQYPGSTATKSFTAYDPAWTVLATGDNAPLPFQGQVVPVLFKNGKWWYGHPNFRRATADVSIAAGSSGAVSLMDDTTDMGTRTAYYTWADSGGPTIDAGDEIFVAWFDAEQKWIILPPSVAGTAGRNRCVIVADSGYYGWRDGDSGTSPYPVIGWNGSTNKTVKLFPSMNGFVGNSEGTVYTVNSSPTAFANNWLVLKQDGRYCITFTHVWGLPSLSLSDANTYLRAAAHDHTYTDNGAPMTTGTATPQAQSLTRKIVGIEARIDFSTGADAYETSTGEQMYYTPSLTPDYEMRVWSTTIGYVRRNGSDINVNLLLTKIHGGNESRPYHVNQFVKVEQTSDS